MKNILLSALSLSALISFAQNPIISEWNITTGTKASFKYYPNPMSPTNAQTTNLSDTADILQVCYNTNFAYVRTNGLPSYQMGPWEGNPNKPSGKESIYKFPLNPSEETGAKTDQPSVGAMAVAVNGTVLYGLSDARSYNNEGYWNQNAWATEGETMGPNGGGHPQEQGEYHYHATPAKLYDDPSTSHSPIIAFAFDGYPIYGPFGYDDPLNTSSSITRMVSGYIERNITQRTTYADGSTAPSPGPNVSSTYPIGYYIEDHDYTGVGHLDEYNGRFCKTPEYPNGTYAYFVATDNNGDPAFPYLIGLQYYGEINVTTGPQSGNNTLPTSGLTCLDINNPTVGIKNNIDNKNDFSIYPNPTNNNVTINLLSNDLKNITIYNVLGEIVYSANTNALSYSISMTNWESGIYYVMVTNSKCDLKTTLKLIKQ